MGATMGAIMGVTMKVIMKAIVGAIYVSSPDAHRRGSSSSRRSFIAHIVEGVCIEASYAMDSLRKLSVIDMSSQRWGSLH